MQAWFPDHKLAFVRGSRGFLHLDKLIQHFPPHKGILLVGWGLKLPGYAARYASNRQIPTCYVEDGFLRSFHPGALHTKPWSLTFDSKAPYYDTRNRTNLQVLLSKREQEGLDAEQRKAGEAGLALVRAARLTKYFSLRIGDEEWTPPPMPGRKLILVIGQVEDDAAIIKGYSRGVRRSTFSNLAVIQRAAQEHPDACILYRPHPDTFHNDRKSRHEKEIASLCSIIEPTVPLQAVFPHVQQVYTGTSLAGFEAALWGIPVTTLGLPFYAASPAINHLQGNKTGFARLDLPELFFVLYLEYTR
jgi:capsule polysaccharide export protein KpsC/LpsZ